MNLDVRHLELVEAIHEEGTVTKAATRLNLTQSALSHQLRGMEESLGTTLFQRMGKVMLVTPAGERLLNTAKLVLAELGRAEKEIAQKEKTPDAVLRISTECYTCYHWLPAHLKVFNEMYPRVQIRIVVEATHQPLQALLEGKIDLGIVTSRPRNVKIAYTPLFSDELVVIMSPGHKLAANAFVDARDFADEHLLAYSVPREQLTVFQSVLVPAGITPRTVSHLQLTEAIVEMVKGGLGIAVFARWAVRPHLRAGTLVALPLTKRGLHREWMAATIRTRTTPKYVRNFLELLSSDSLVKVIEPSEEPAMRARRRI
jgi:LysR family transcriptional regulator for metE and metH